MFQLKPGGAATLELDGADVTSWEVGHRTAQVELSLEVAWGTSGAMAEFVYSTDLFDAALIGNLADDLVRVLEVTCASPDVPLSSLGLAEPAPHGRATPGLVRRPRRPAPPRQTPEPPGC